MLNPDLPVVRAGGSMGFEPRRLKRLAYSPSCFLLLAGWPTRASDARRPPHDSFGRAWREMFDEFALGRPSATRRCWSPTRPDRTVARARRRHISCVLSPTRDLDAPIDWARMAPAIASASATLENAAGGFSPTASRSRHVDDPADWAARGSAAPFAAADSCRQTGLCARQPVGRDVVFHAFGHPAGRRRPDGPRCPAGWPPSTSSAETAPTAPGPGGDDHRPTRQSPRGGTDDPRRCARIGSRRAHGRSTRRASPIRPCAPPSRMPRAARGHGRADYRATLLLPAGEAPYVSALSASPLADGVRRLPRAPDPRLCSTRRGPSSTASSADQAASGPASTRPATHPLCMPQMHAHDRRWHIPRAHVEAFLERCGSDITVTGYRTYATLSGRCTARRP